MKEQVNKWMNEKTNEWTDEQVNEFLMMMKQPFQVGEATLESSRTFTIVY